MDLGFYEEQQLLQRSARDVLAKECSPAMVRRLHESEKRFSSALWKQMAELSWLGLSFDAKYGGLGADLVTVAALAEELGRACDPTPYLDTVIACGMLLAHFADEAQRARLLPKLVDGSLLVSLAVLEEDACYAPESIRLRAREEQGAYVLRGAKRFVLNVHLCDLLLVAVRTAEPSVSGQGITLLLMDPKSAGIEAVPLRALALGKQFEVRFDEVRVPIENRVGLVDAAWPAIERSVTRTAAIASAMAVGGARRVLEMTVDYVKLRVQFGRPIGAFQAVQHQLANIWTDVETAWLASYEAISLLSEGLAADAQVALAKSWACETFVHTCLTAHQLFGGLGYMWESDLHLFTRKAKDLELAWGTPRFYRKNLAKFL